MASTHFSEIPAWDGDPGTFEAYATSCKWFERGTKESERKLVVARLWGRLTGSAKSVVRYLEPSEYDDPQGLQRFLDVLRASPLQQLPVPDSFMRLERWNSLRRREKESVTELIVREEELFTELQQSLNRARKDRDASSFLPTSRVAEAAEPSTPTESASPSPGGTRSPEAGRRSSTSRQPEAPRVSSMSGAVPMATDFFADEMRGYRLLKASHLTHHEKQNVLVQTNNSTSFALIRRALRTLFSDDAEHGRQPQRKIWWNMNSMKMTRGVMTMKEKWLNHMIKVGHGTRRPIGLTGRLMTGATMIFPGIRKLLTTTIGKKKRFSPWKKQMFPKKRSFVRHTR